MSCGDISFSSGNLAHFRIVLLLVFEYEDESADKSFFSEIISSISDAKFTPDGNYMIARDFLTVKLWDVRSEKEPVSITPIHNFLNDKLCDLYENDCIFDKFECDSSLDGSCVQSIELLILFVSSVSWRLQAKILNESTFYISIVVTARSRQLDILNCSIFTFGNDISESISPNLCQAQAHYAWIACFLCVYCAIWGTGWKGVYNLICLWGTWAADELARISLGPQWLLFFRAF